MKDLAGRTAVVTGASRGIGVHIARTLAAEGMNLVLAARSASELEAVGLELRQAGGAVLMIPTDVSTQAGREKLIEAAVEKFGAIDVLVNNAAQITVAAYHHLSQEQIAQTILVNLTAPLLLARLALPHMLAQGRGHIVNVASTAGTFGVASLEAYVATKAGLIAFAETVRASYQGEGISASAICPALVAEAGMFHRVQHETGVPTPPLLGTVTPTQVAAAVVHSIKHDVPVVYVTKGPAGPLLLLHALFPRLFERLMPLTGGTLYQRAALIYNEQRADGQLG